MPAAIALFFASIMTFFVTWTTHKTEAEWRTTGAEVAAVQAINYHTAVVAYWKASGVSSGTIADSSIKLPVGLVRDSNWTNVVLNGHVFSYETAPTNQPLLASEVTLRSDGYGYIAAVKRGAAVVDTNGFARGFSYPAAIVDGAVVIITP